MTHFKIKISRDERLLEQHLARMDRRREFRRGLAEAVTLLLAIPAVIVWCFLLDCAFSAIR